MTWTTIGTSGRPADALPRRGPWTRRAALLAAVMAGAAAGALAVPAGAAQAGFDGDGLARLLRFMALLKGALVLAALGAALWRLAEPISPPRLAAYLAAGGAAAAGPGLVWNMSHLGLGAALLHGGLLAILLLLWRDPAVAARLAAAPGRRRAPPRAARQRGGGVGKASTPAV